MNYDRGKMEGEPLMIAGDGADESRRKRRRLILALVAVLVGQQLAEAYLSLTV